METDKQFSVNVLQELNDYLTNQNDRLNKCALFVLYLYFSS